MSINAGDIHRGEIWLVDFDPTRGNEINKKRPAVVINSDSFSGLAIRLVAPITSWQSKFQDKLWFTKIESDQLNNLDKDSAVSALQLRGLSVERFEKMIGRVSANQMESIVASIAAVIEYV